MAQITKENVGSLKVAWTYHTGALEQVGDFKHMATFETTPILVDGKLFLTTPHNHVIALEPETGRKLWEFDAMVNLTEHGFSEMTSRGVSAWRDPGAKRGAVCALRLFMGTIDARLIALDAATGKPCNDFGKGGQVDLTRDVQLRDAGDYQVTSAPAIAGNVVITGSSIGDNRAVDVERGIVRGFDVRSGKQLWSWDPIPWAAKTTPRTGAGNAWSTLSVDAERDLVFVPTGSAAPDFYGGMRKGDGKWADSVVALKASTGEFVWGFQVVHHDLWDYDVASQPTLFAWKDGTPAIAITTKMGRVFVLNRLTGAALIPVEERPAPKSDVPGEESWPTQPSSISVSPEQMSADDAWGRTPEDREACAKLMTAARADGIFTPPSVRGSLLFPGNLGGVNWGSAAYDPQRHLLVMDLNRIVTMVRLIPRAELSGDRGKSSEGDRAHGEWARQTGAPYGMFRTPLLAPGAQIAPCNRPPWGTVAAVNLFTGEKVWDVPLGTYVEGRSTGTANLGGPIVTAGGVVFAAATMDNQIRGFDVETGKEIWKFELPAGGQATPMTFMGKDGKQYLVIAAGGHGKLGTKQGDAVVAFSLP